MRCKLFPFIKGQRLEIGSHGFELVPMAHLLSSFDMRRPITQGAPVRDLAPSVPPAGVALSLLLLAAQVLPQLAASGLVGINMLVKRLMADWQLAPANRRLARHSQARAQSQRFCFAKIAWLAAHRLAWADSLYARGCEKVPG